MSERTVPGAPVSEAWSATATPGTPGWMRVPNGLSEKETREWIAVSRSELQASWGDSWRAEFAGPIQQMLDQAVEGRSPDTLLELLYWPYFVPLAGQVRVEAGPSAAPEEWAAAGFEVDGYPGAEIGPGLQCMEELVIRPDEGTPFTVVRASFVFINGGESVAVSVQPTTLDIFTHMTPGLHALLGNLEVRRGDGSFFAAQPVTGFTGAAEDQWPIEDDR